MESSWTYHGSSESKQFGSACSPVSIYLSAYIHNKENNTWRAGGPATAAQPSQQYGSAYSPVSIRLPTYINNKENNTWRAGGPATAAQEASSTVLPALQYLSIYQIISITRSITWRAAGPAKAAQEASSTVLPALQYLSIYQLISITRIILFCSQSKINLFLLGGALQVIRVRLRIFLKSPIFLCLKVV